MSLQYNQYLFAVGISHCTAVCCIVIFVLVVVVKNRLFDSLNDFLGV